MAAAARRSVAQEEIYVRRVAVEAAHDVVGDMGKGGDAMCEAVTRGHQSD